MSRIASHPLRILVLAALPLALGLSGCDCRRTVNSDSGDGFDGGDGLDANTNPDSATCPAPNEVTEMTCDDGCDNDGDGFIDCNDFDCDTEPACMGVMEICDDGIDNDFDTFIDCDDFDCDGDPACSETNCTDGIDNDGDSFIDCDDFDCEADPACVLTATIYELQDPAMRTAAGINDGDFVLVANVIVTGVEGPTGMTTAFFIQETGAPEFGGIYVYVPSSAAGMFPVAVGDNIDLVGQYSEFDGLGAGMETVSELGFISSLTVNSSGNSLPAPVVFTDASLIATGGAMAETYEGVLVEITGPVDVTAVNLGASATTSFTITGGLNVADDLFAYPVPAVNDTFTLLRGPLMFNAFEQWFELLPRDFMDYGLEASITGITPAASAVADNGTVDVTVHLNAPATAGGVDVCVETDVVTLTTAGVVNIPAGMDSFPVTLTDTGTDVSTGGVAAVVSATLSGVCPPAGGPDATADVWIDMAANLPSPTTITPADTTFDVGTVNPMVVTLSVAPLAPFGISVLLTSSDPTIASVPAEMNVAMGSTTGMFDLSALLPGGPVDITATIAGNSAMTTASVTGAANGLVISEVLYDVTGTDTGLEWIELYNGSGGVMDISGWVIANGGNSYGVIFTFPAGSMIPDQGCWVLGGPMTKAANGNPTYETGLDLGFTTDIQNSGMTTADAVALWNNAALTGTPVDAVVYGPPGTNVNGLVDETGNSGPGNEDVGDAPANESIERTGPASWVIQPSPTPNNCMLLMP